MAEIPANPEQNDILLLLQNVDEIGLPGGVEVMIYFVGAVAVVQEQFEIVSRLIVQADDALPGELRMRSGKSCRSIDMLIVIDRSSADAASH